MGGFGGLQDLLGNEEIRARLLSREGRDVLTTAASMATKDPGTAAALLEDPAVQSAVGKGVDMQAAYDWDSGRPGEMPMNVYLGILAHERYAREALILHSGYEVYTNTTPLSTIVREEGGDVDALTSPRLKPDVYVAEQGAVIELKHENSADRAAPEARVYVSELQKAGLPAHLATPGEMVESTLSVENFGGIGAWDITFGVHDAGAATWSMRRPSKDAPEPMVGPSSKDQRVVDDGPEGMRERIPEMLRVASDVVVIAAVIALAAVAAVVLWRVLGPFLLPILVGAGWGLA
jgi:hypothetical protein